MKKVRLKTKNHGDTSKLTITGKAGSGKTTNLNEKLKSFQGAVLSFTTDKIIGADFKDFNIIDFTKLQSTVNESALDKMLDKILNGTSEKTLVLIGEEISDEQLGILKILLGFNFNSDEPTLFAMDNTSEITAIPQMKDVFNSILMFVDSNGRKCKKTFISTSQKK